MAQYNPRTGITSYREEINLEDLLGGEPVPSASAATAPQAAPSAAPAPALSAGMLPAAQAPAAAPIGGWRWSMVSEGTGENPSAQYDWLWDAAAAQSDPGFDWNPTPARPSGQLDYRSLGINEGTDMGSAWFDTGSGRQVSDPAAIQQAQIAQQAAADAQLPNLAQFDNLDEIYPIIEQIQRGLGIRSVVRMIETGRIHPSVAAQLGPYVAARQAEDDDRRGFDSHLNDWIGTAKTHVENILESWQEDPERALLGINDPLTSWLWGEVLDKDYDPNMNMFGGATKDTLQEASERYDPRFFSAGQNAIESIIAGMAGTYLGGTTFGQTPTGSAAIAAGRAGIAAANGGDKEAMRAQIISALIAQGVDVASPYVASWINDTLAAMTGDSVEEVGLSARGMLADAGDATKKLQFADAGTTMTDVIPTGGGYDPATGQEFTTTYPAWTVDSSLPLGEPMGWTSGGMLSTESLDAEDSELTQADAENLQTLEAGDTPPAAEPTVTSQDVTKYAKVAKSLYDILNPDSPSGDGEAPAPADAPAAPAEDASEEEKVAYVEQLATYANLDAAAMAEAGLTPGTQPYYEYIMTQMDSIINQALEGVDVDSADLATQLRAKTAEEMKSLERALYVRGQMEQLMGSGTYVDPATGLDEEVIAPDGQQVNPGRAAYMRGLARSADSLGRLRGGGARDFIGGMLGRDIDPFNMQARADERSELEEQYLLEEERKRRRGMFSGMGY